MKKNLILILLIFCSIVSVNAKVKLPALVGDNMVLQQNTDVKIWGWSEPKATIEIAPSWCDAVKVKADKEGNWSAIVKTPAASFDVQTMTISDGEAVTLNNILIGEVWICSGQSNMDIPVQGGRDCPIEHSQEIIVESAQYPNIRLFFVKIDAALEKKSDVTGNWKSASPSVVKKFSAISYLYGLNLHKALNIPIGIINSSCGGTWIEAWFPAELQKDFEDFDPESVGRKEMSGFNTLEVQYNAMIYPLHNYAIKGFCWYQGESNVGRGSSSSNYADKMVAMINNWRNIWGGDKKPFYYVEIVPYEYGENDINGALLREQQAKVMSMIDNVGMVCTNDLIYDYETSNIHPSQKVPVAKRLAYWALSKDYGYGDAIKPIGPTFKSMEVNNGVVKVSFDGGDYGFVIKGEIPGFELAGADKVFHPAKAVRMRPDATVLYLSTYDVARPIAVRYNFKNCSPGKLWDAFGQPVVPFRSDDF
ncbi:sialate O-acetylesterase [Sunxiuqinia sp. A32]|uniref:sialate O-acetylesterase n=1 Tax=Sunxiuqinia sp. A32 TaxID=3461496 RepID=UPI004045C0A1